MFFFWVKRATSGVAYVGENFFFRDVLRCRGARVLVWRLGRLLVGVGWRRLLALVLVSEMGFCRRALARRRILKESQGFFCVRYTFFFFAVKRTLLRWIRGILL
jgi:hypothetical protein